MADDPYSKYLGLPPGKRPPKACELLGLPVGTADADAIDAAAADCMDRLDRYALASDRATREQVQRLMNEVAKARTKLVARLPKAKPEPNEKQEPEASEAAAAPGKPRVDTTRLAKQENAPRVPVPAAPQPAVTAPAVAKEPNPNRSAILFWSAVGTVWAASLAAVFFVTFAIAKPEPVDSPNETTSDRTFASNESSDADSPGPVTETSPDPKPDPDSLKPDPDKQTPVPVAKPIAPVPVIALPPFKQVETKWRQNPQDKKWELTIIGTLQREDIESPVVALRKNMLLQEVSGLGSYRPHFWSDPRRPDDPRNGGNWKRYYRVEQTRPYTDSFYLGLTHIPKPVGAISNLSAKFHLRVAQNLRYTDIPLTAQGEWRTLQSGIRVKIDLTGKGNTSSDPETLGKRVESYHGATVHYQDAYLRAGPTYIEAYAVYDDGSGGKSIYGAGGGSQGDTYYNFLKFMGGRSGQRMTAVRIYYAESWEEQEIQVDWDQLPTPLDDNAQASTEAAPVTPEPTPEQIAAKEAEQEQLAARQRQEDIRRQRLEQKRLEAEQQREAERQQQLAKQKQRDEYFVQRDRLKGEGLRRMIAGGFKEWNGGHMVDLEPEFEDGEIVGLKISSVINQNTRLIDLTPLKGLPLRRLEIKARHIETLAPLQGMPLETLILNDCEKLHDITALKGMPITSISISEAKIKDLEPLRGMPLKELYLNDLLWITTTAPLEGAELESVQISSCAKLENLKGLESMRADELKAKFYGNINLGDITALKGLTFSHLSIKDCDDLKSLDGLQGVTVDVLEIDAIYLKDLSPLKETDITHMFKLSGSSITDLTPISRQRLKYLTLNCSSLRSLKGVDSMPSLQSLTGYTDLPKQEVERLKRARPKLRVKLY